MVIISGIVMSALTFSFPTTHLTALDLCVDLSDSSSPRVDFDPHEGTPGLPHVALPGMLKVNVSTFDGRNILRLSFEPNTSSTAIEDSPSSLISLSHASSCSLPISPVSLPLSDPEDMFSQSNSAFLKSPTLQRFDMLTLSSPDDMFPACADASASADIALLNFLGNMPTASFPSFQNDFSQPNTEFREEMSFRDSDMSLQSQPSPLFISDSSPNFLMLDGNLDKKEIEQANLSSSHETSIAAIPEWLSNLCIKTADSHSNSSPHSYEGSTSSPNPSTFISHHHSSVLDTESDNVLPRNDFSESDFADNETEYSGASRVSNHSRPSLSTKPYSRPKRIATPHSSDLYTVECTHPGCGRTFRCHYTRDTHEKSHLPKQRKSFRCEYDDCEETFTRAHDRLRHEVAQHGKTCEHTCNKCSRFFSSEMMLIKHRCPRSH